MDEGRMARSVESPSRCCLETGKAPQPTAGAPKAAAWIYDQSGMAGAHGWGVVCAEEEHPYTKFPMLEPDES